MRKRVVVIAGVVVLGGLAAAIVPALAGSSGAGEPLQTTTSKPISTTPPIQTTPPISSTTKPAPTSYPVTATPTETSYPADK